MYIIHPSHSFQCIYIILLQEIHVHSSGVVLVIKEKMVELLFQNTLIYSRCKYINAIIHSPGVVLVIKEKINEILFLNTYTLLYSWCKYINAIMHSSGVVLVIKEKIIELLFLNTLIYSQCKYIKLNAIMLKNSNSPTLISCTTTCTQH